MAFVAVLCQPACAAEHDLSVLQCLGALLQVGPGESGAPLPDLAGARAQLPLRQGGLGLRSAVKHAPAAFLASWADSASVIASGNRGLGDTLLRELAAPAPAASCLVALRAASQLLASRAVDDALLGRLEAALDPASLDLLSSSQAGPHAACVFTSRPTSPELTLDSACFRVLLLRRLRLPLPLVAASCRCRMQLDVLGSGLLRSERAHGACCSTSLP